MSILSVIGNTPLVELKCMNGNQKVRTLATEEDTFAGISSVAAVAGALQVAQQMGSGTIVTIIPDRGDRYLSTMLFRSVCPKCPP